MIWVLTWRGTAYPKKNFSFRPTESALQPFSLDKTQSKVSRFKLLPNARPFSPAIALIQSIFLQDFL
jgi:hypothetical protein